MLPIVLASILALAICLERLWFLQKEKIVPGALDLGGGTVTSSGSYDAFLAAMSSNGQHLWSGGFGGRSTEFIRDLTLGPAGEVTVVGFYGSLAGGNVTSFGGPRLTSVRQSDMFVFTLGP